MLNQKIKLIAILSVATISLNILLPQTSYAEVIESKTSVLLSNYQIQTGTVNGRKTSEATTTSGIFSQEIDTPIIANYQGHTDTITTLAISPNDKYLASGSEDKTLRLYKLSDKLENSTNTTNSGIILGSHDTIITKVIFNPSGDRIVSSSTDGNIKIWNVNEEKQISEYNAKQGNIKDILFSADGRTLYCAYEEGTIVAFDFESGRQKSKLMITSKMNAITYNNKNRTIIAGCEDGNVYVVSAQGLSIMKTIKKAIDSEEEAPVEFLAVSPDGSYLVISNSQSIQPTIYNINRNYQKQKPNENKFIYEGLNIWNDISFTDEGLYLIGCDKVNDHVAVFDFTDGTLKKDLNIHPTAYTLSKSGNYIAVGNLMDEINLYDSSKYKTPTVTSINIDTQDTTFRKNNAVLLKVYANYSNGTSKILDNKDLEWYLSDSDTAIINQGIFYSWANKTINISVSYKDFNYSILADVVGDGSTGEKINSIAYGGASRFVTVGENGILKTSNSGENWAKLPSITTNNINSIIYANGKFVAAGNNGTILTSEEGIHWKAFSIDENFNIQVILCDEDKYVIYGENNMQAESQDGLSWSINSNK